MYLRLLAFSLATLSLAAPASFAEDAAAAPSPGADLTSLKLRASQSEDGLFQLNQVAAQIQGGNSLNDILGGLLNAVPDAFASGLRYEVAGQVRIAQLRAERYATILSSDLNGDGSVSRDEIADSLAFGPSRRGSAAEALISYDADRNDILSPDEIHTATSDVRDMGNGRRNNALIAEILDFDADGTLTAAELERVNAALRLPEALQ